MRLDRRSLIGHCDPVARHPIHVAMWASVAVTNACGSSPSTQAETAATDATSPTTTLVDLTATYPIITAPIDVTPYALSWTVDPATALDASSYAHSARRPDPRCGGEPPGAGASTEVTYSDVSIGITIMATPLQGFQACPVAPPASVAVALDQPLGDRTLVDTGVGWRITADLALLFRLHQGGCIETREEEVFVYMSDKPPTRSGTFRDLADNDGAYWSVRRFPDRVAVFLSLESDGDVDVMMDDQTARDFATALLWAIETAP